MEGNVEQLWLRTSPRREISVKLVKEVGRLSVYIEGAKRLYLVGQEGAWVVYSAQTLQALEGQWRCHREAVLGVIWTWYDLHLLKCRQRQSPATCLELILDRGEDARTRLCAAMSLFKSVAQKQAPARMFPACVKAMVLICSQEPEAVQWLRYHALIQHYNDAREDVARCWFRLAALCDQMEREIHARGRVPVEMHQALQSALIHAVSRIPAW